MDWVSLIAVIAVAAGAAALAYVVGHDRGWRKGAAIAQRDWSDAFYDAALSKYAEWPPRPSQAP